MLASPAFYVLSLGQESLLKVKLTCLADPGGLEPVGIGLALLEQFFVPGSSYFPGSDGVGFGGGDAILVAKPPIDRKMRFELRGIGGNRPS